MLLPRHGTAPAFPWALRPWPSVLVTWGPGGGSELHAHHCWHVLVGLDGPLTVRERARGRGKRAAVVATAPDAPHAVDASGTRVSIVFIEPESHAGERLRAALPARPVVALEGEPAAMVAAALTEVVRAPAAGAGAHVANALAALGAGLEAPAPRHPGVRRVLRHLRATTPGLVISRVAPVSAGGLALLLVAMFPANVYAANHGVSVAGAPATALGLRLAIQVLFVVALLVAGFRAPRAPAGAGPSR